MRTENGVLLSNRGPGFLVFLERIDVHPPLENQHRMDSMPMIDQLLDGLREGGLGKTADWLEPGLREFLLSRAIGVKVLVWGKSLRQGSENR